MFHSKRQRNKVRCITVGNQSGEINYVTLNRIQSKFGFPNIMTGYPKVRKGVLFAKRTPFREKDLIFAKRTYETCTGLIFTNYFIVLKVK